MEMLLRYIQVHLNMSEVQV